MSKSKHKKDYWRYPFEVFAVMVLCRLCRVLPSAWLQPAGTILGEAAYYLIPRRRWTTLNNLRLAFKDPTFNHSMLAHRAYRTLGRNILEFLHSVAMSRTQILESVKVEGRQHMDEAIRSGKGVILLGAHYGNWELMNSVNSALGYQTHVVGRAMDNPLMNRMINRWRERFGSKIINSRSRNSLREILSALHKKTAVGFLIDQNVVGDRGVFVDFFGRLAHTHKVVALVALKTGAQIIPMFMRQDANGKSLLSYGEPLPLVRTGNRENDVSENTQVMTHLLEKEIREKPEQWLWMHDRWKKRPASGRMAVFLDRDGTINQETGTIRDPADLKLLPHSAGAIRRLNQNGIKVVVVTNQSGVARGYLNEDDVRKVHEKLTGLLEKEGAFLDGIYYCPHHPTEGTNSYRRKCACRKPEPDMMLRAASEMGLDLDQSFVVGDKQIDVELAHRVNSQGILVLTGYGQVEHDRPMKNGVSPDHVAPNLKVAVEWILARVKGLAR